ncbi:hypothetical protein JXB27_01995, partial [Candidatus Woesearchaeota archaeon]|nr:hypothetical protein [Candidatus Woesearchaeota archaeon]
MKKELYSLILGMLYVFVAYGTTKIFFSNEACISITMIVMTSLLFVPSISRFLTRNVKIETKNSAVRFFRTYKTLMCIFLFLFIGIFAGYLIIGSFAPESISYQDKIIQQQNALAVNKEISDTNKLFGIIMNNIEVIIISFVVSLFYGAGAFFLLVRTASVFASFILGFSSMIAKSTQTTALLLSVHFVPEIFGFI